MLSITLKIAVDAPIPSAKVSTAITANPGVLRRFLSAYRTSCPSVSMVAPSSVDVSSTLTLAGLRPCLPQLVQVGTFPDPVGIPLPPSHSIHEHHPHLLR